VTEQPLYECYWLYGAVDVVSGSSFFLEMSALDGDEFTVFLAELSREYAESLNVVIIDGAGAHTSPRLAVPENVVLVRLPPYCPDLNPVERLWRDVKAHIDVTVAAHRENLVALRDHVAARLCAYTDAQMHALTGYRYLVEAAKALE